MLYLFVFYSSFLTLNFIDIHENKVSHLLLFIISKKATSINKTKKLSNLSLNTYEFESLDKGYEQIKSSFLGIAGVYKLVNKDNPMRFYIGSSVNLSRRMKEYVDLTSGIRLPQSSSEIEISQTPASKWNLTILNVSSPQLALIHEQFALIKFEPTINKYFKVVPKIYPQWGELDIAIDKIKVYQSFFLTNEFGFIRFEKFLKVFMICKELKFKIVDAGNVGYANLVFVYKQSSPYNEPIVYSSINKALKALSISYQTLMDCIENKHIYSQGREKDLILSFEPISLENLSEYSCKNKYDNNLRKAVSCYNKEFKLVFEFNFTREMAKHLKIDGKKARTAISKGAYLDYILVTKTVSFRKVVYVFDSETFKLLMELKSITAAMNFAKVNFYTMKKIIETNKPHNNKIYSYNKELKTQ